MIADERSQIGDRDEICWMSATDLARSIRRKQLSPVEVTRAVLNRIERLNSQLNAFVTLTPQAAMREARRAEQALMQRSASIGPLHRLADRKKLYGSQ